MQVRFWRPWPADGVLYEPGDVVELPIEEAAAVCAAGAGEVIETPGEVAAVEPGEHTVRVAPKKRRRKSA